MASASGGGGAHVVRLGVGQVTVHRDTAPVRGVLDGASQVARRAGEYLADAGCALGAAQTTLHLLPSASEETFLLEVPLEQTHGQVADSLRQVAFQLAAQLFAQSVEVAAEVLDLHS